MKLARLVIASLWIMSSLRPAAADPCKVAEKYIRDSMHRIDSVGQTAIDMAVKCMFDGPDDKLVDALGKQTTAAFANTPMPAEASKCARGINDVSEMFRATGQAAGIRVGAAWSRCSTKARSFIADQQKKGKSADEIVTALKPMLDEWMATLH